MNTEIRPVTPEELPAFNAVSAYVFGSSQSGYGELDDPDAASPWVAVAPEHTLAAFVDGRIATSLGTHPFTVQLNGRPVPAAGVTQVGTYPEFRRRGLVRRTMVEALTRYREEGRPFAILWASYAAIYQRFGYGPASSAHHYEFDPREVAFRETLPDTGSVRLLPPEEVRPLAERVRAAWLAPRNMAFDYSEGWWRSRLQQFGDRRRYFAVHLDDGGYPRGYVIYDTAEDLGGWRTTGPDQSMNVSAFHALDVASHRALWNYLRAHDLVKRVRWRYVPADDITPDLLLEPRELHHHSGDALWMRITDVETLLPLRPYATRGALTLAVRDEVLPWNNGTYRLEAGEDESTVTRTTGSADLVLSVAALSTLVSGYRSATHLSRAGLVEGAPDALRLADAMFATAYAPYVTDIF
jgi:predicted acetyltransferase